MRGWCGDASSSMDTAHSQRTKSTAGDRPAVSQPAPVPGALAPTSPTYGIPVQPRGAREYPATNTAVGVSAARPQEPLQLGAAGTAQHIWRHFTVLHTMSSAPPEPLLLGSTTCVFPQSKHPPSCTKSQPSKAKLCWNTHLGDNMLNFMGTIHRQ